MKSRFHYSSSVSLGKVYQAAIFEDHVIGRVRIGTTQVHIVQVIILDFFLVDTDGGEDVRAVGSDEGLVLGAQGGTDGHPPEVIRVLIDVLNDAVYKERINRARLLFGFALCLRYQPRHTAL